jgi:hypothetical protein
MTAAFVPEQFSEPLVSPDTATLFRRTPYISPSEYKAAPTAVAVNNLVPGGSEAEQLGALAAVISRASDWADTICFHRADGTLAASPSTESGWVTPKDNGTLALICNYKPVLEVDALALGTGPANMENIGDEAAQNLTLQGPIIQLAYGLSSFGPSTTFPAVPLVNGKVYAVWVYVNGFPHTSLADSADEGAESIVVAPSTPGAGRVYGVYEGTQLTIHDGANTEVILVTGIEGLTLKLAAPLQYGHAVPEAPDAIRVSAVPWIVEQACISLTSALVKMRGTRAMVIPSSPSKTSSPPRQADSQPAGQVGQTDYENAERMLQPFIVPVLRST